tara:strand:- start:180 stop:482 length:303 start_codon:yes stop_codon:yes gene_type:complete
MTHKELTKLVHGKTCRTERKIGNNTYARILHNGSIAVRLYSTDVVTIHTDNSATLRNGGHKTDTTKNRINKYSPVKVFQKNWEWFTADGTPFQEGMRVYA